MVSVDDQDGGIGRETAHYLARGPESLVIDGYRGWLHFAAHRDAQRLQEIWNRFNRRLDPHSARLAMAGLERLIRQLGACANCPLRFHCQGTQHLCRDECLVLSMISGLQHGDDAASFLSARALTSQVKALEVIAAGGEFAITLRAAGQVLLPVEAATIMTIAGTAGGPPSSSLH